VRDQLRRLEARKRELTADLKSQESVMDIAIHPNLPDLYRRKVAKLQQVLADEATRPQAVEIIRSLIDQIEVHPGQKRGHCEIVVVERWLRSSLSPNKKRPPLLGKRRYVLDGCGGRICSSTYQVRVEEGRLRLVTGARNHLDLQLRLLTSVALASDS
jgi:hypothetical protein